MIVRSAKVRELICRTFPDGTVSRSASLSFDETSCTTVRLSKEEHDSLAVAMREGRRFVISVNVESPAMQAGPGAP